MEAGSYTQVSTWLLGFVLKILTWTFEKGLAWVEQPEYQSSLKGIAFILQRRSLFLQHTEATWKPQLIRMQKISDCEVLNPIGQICNETPMKRGQEDYKSQKTRLPAAKTGQGSRNMKSQQYGCLNKTCIMTPLFDMPV